jgi:MAE_28990/MAE_18760-like HEPN
MFPELQLEILDRFTSVETHFRNSPKATSGANTETSQTTKGLVFVQIYGIYEYTARNVTRAAIEGIAAHGHRMNELRTSLQALFLDPQLRAIRDCGEGTAWERRLDLVERAASREEITSVAAMPHDGTFFKHTQIVLILKVLGIKRKFTTRVRHLYKLDEIVNNRHSISHGEATALEVGRRYSRAEIMRDIRLMRGICLRLISIVAEHCSLPERHTRH